MSGLTEHGGSSPSIPQITSLPHILHVCCWERPAAWPQNIGKTHKQVCASVHTDGTRAHGHMDTVVAPKFVHFSLSLSLSPWTQCLYTFNISPDRQTAASSVLSAEPWLKQKRRRARPTVSESEEVGADYGAPEEAFQSC